MCFHKGCSSYRKSIRRDVIEGEFAVLLNDITPSPAKLSIAKRMFSAAWNERQDRARENAALYAQKIKELDAQVEALLSRLMEANTSTVIKAYEKKIGQIEQEKLLLAEKAEATGKPKATFEQMFELAIRFPASLWKVWETGRFDLQRLVLRLAFADRLAYCRNEGFRTPEVSFLFKVLGGESVRDCKMADRQGFEPWRRSPAYTLSRRAPSTTRPPVRDALLHRAAPRAQPDFRSLRVAVTKNRVWCFSLRLTVEFDKRGRLGPITLPEPPIAASPGFPHDRSQ